MNGEVGKLIDLSMDSGLHEESIGRGKTDDGGDDDGSEQTRSDEISCDESERNDHQNEKIKRLESLLNKCKVVFFKCKISLHYHFYSDTS